MASDPRGVGLPVNSACYLLVKGVWNVHDYQIFGCDMLGRADS